MKTIKNLLWSLLPMLCLAFAVSCTDPGTDDGGGKLPAVEKDSTINLAKDVVNAGLDGGTYVVEYTIDNPHQGEKVTAKASADWVTDINTNISGALTLKVAANTGTESRECIVTVKYRYANDVAFVVRQGAKINQTFAITNIVSDYFSYTVDIIPEDKLTPYIVMSAEPEYIIGSEFKTGQDFYEDDMLYFAWVGGFYGQSAVEIVQQRAKVGDQKDVTVTGGAPGTPYTLYLYYVDYESGALLSDVETFVVWTKTPELQSAEFNVDYTVESCMIHADVTPKTALPTSSNGNYYFDVLSKDYIDSYLQDLVDFKTGEPYFTTVEEIVEYYWCRAVANMMTNNYSAADIIEEFTCLDLYPDDDVNPSHFDFELLALHEYYLFAFAMDEMALCMTTPQCVLITTEDVEMSDNNITPSVSKITARTATISFETTCDDFYVAGWATADDWATFGNNDAEIVEHLLANNAYEYIVGNYSMNVIGLEPETEYILYAFGSRGGKPTTALFTCPFTTKSGAAGSASIEIVDHGYFAASDLAEAPGWEFLSGDYYSGKFILPIEVDIKGDWQSFYWTIWDWTNRYDEYNDEQYMDNLVWSINEYGSMDPGKTYTILGDGCSYTLVATVIDMDGLFSNLAKIKVNTSYDGARTEDVIEWAEEWADENDGPDLSSAAVADYRPIFKQKTKRSKVSTLNLKSEEKVVAPDEMVIRR